MKRINVRLDDLIYEKVKISAQSKSKTVNKFITDLLTSEFDKPKDIREIEELDKKISFLNDKIISISKKQKYHYDLSVQHFVNQGYYENANPNKDKCYQELLNSYKDKFNE